MGKPLTKEEFVLRHSAFFQNIGFDVQFAAFIYYALDLGYEDVISYESEDDFVIDRVCKDLKVKEYYQVKHSKNADAKMTDSDSDFWKTIDNWVELYNLSSAEEKKVFFVQGKFIILTNKEVDNEFYKYITNLRNGICEIKDVINYLNVVLSEKRSYKGTIEKLINLKDTTLNQFLHKIEIIRYNDFLMSLYELFLHKYYKPNYADQILKDLIGKMWSNKLKKNTSLRFTGEQFVKEYKGILENVSCDLKLTIDFEDDPILYDDVEADMMIKQLKSVKEISEDSTKDDFCQAFYLAFFFKIKSAIEGLKKQQIITDELEKKLDNSAIRKWQGSFIKYHTKILQKSSDYSSEEKEEAGRNTLHETLETPINVIGYTVDEDFSKGWYLRLSNMGKVTWHFDWFKKYIEKK